jgi:hypothetical protein
MELMVHQLIDELFHKQIEYKQHKPLAEFPGQKQEVAFERKMYHWLMPTKQSHGAVSGYFRHTKLHQGFEEAQKTSNI